MILGTVLLVSCAGQPAPSTSSEGSRLERPAGLVGGDVLKVEDGDTFVLGTVGGEITIRLLGVNAPERDECLHDGASIGLASYLDNRAVGVEDFGVDQFGRTLGYVWAGDTFVNLALVASGLAIAITPGDTDTWGPSLLAAEDTAYRAELGLWDRVACEGGAAAEVGLAIDTAGHNPPGADDQVLDLEYVTIINNGDGAVNVSGWVLRDESSAHRFRFSDGSTIGPGAGLMVTSDNPGWEPGGGPVWNNTGDMALLLTPDGGVAARQRYRP